MARTSVMFDLVSRVLPPKGYGLSSRGRRNPTPPPAVITIDSGFEEDYDVPTSRVSRKRKAKTQPKPAQKPIDLFSDSDASDDSNGSDGFINTAERDDEDEEVTVVYHNSTDPVEETPETPLRKPNIVFWTSGAPQPDQPETMAQALGPLDSEADYRDMNRHLRCAKRLRLEGAETSNFTIDDSEKIRALQRPFARLVMDAECAYLSQVAISRNPTRTSGGPIILTRQAYDGAGFQVDCKGPMMKAIHDFRVKPREATRYTTEAATKRHVRWHQFESSHFL
ncbi:hypothetical protein F4778DRAFT_784062 [Xylariomycetidae sp. FL2044]|nr:hypothetical protein F4778DRAFT_784062 [Xylariomycetidae sp. FL2044]